MLAEIILKQTFTLVAIIIFTCYCLPIKPFSGAVYIQTSTMMAAYKYSVNGNHFSFLSI